MLHRNGIKRHLDAISCLIPLMGKPKIGAIAKEALLTSIGMHDARIDSFILDETNLKVNIVAELTKKYRNCVTALTLNINSDPVSIGTNRPSSQENNEVTPAEKSMESFVKVLHFCAAVVASATSRSEAGTPSIRGEMLKLFIDDFLQTVKSCLLDNGEEQVLAAQSVLRRLLLETFAAPAEKKEKGNASNLQNSSGSSSDHLIAGFARITNSLCITTTHFVCDNEDILQVLVRRVGSVSRSVSVSTIQLLSSLLTISSLTEACQLVLGRSTGDSILGRTKEGMNLSEAPVDSYSDINASLESFEAQFMSCCNVVALEDYTQASVNHILGKVASTVESIHFHFHPDMSDEDAGHLFLVSLQKLQSFLSLKYDEQLAVTGLVYKCIIVLLASVLNSPSPTFILRVFQMLSKFFESVHKLEAELESHKVNIPEVDAKFEIVREVLAAPSSSAPHNRKVVDTENHQVVRILESSIIIEELIHEMEGAILAFKQLIFLSARTSGSESHSSSDPPPILLQDASVGLRSLNEDAWSTDDEEVNQGDTSYEEEGLDVSDVTLLSETLTMDNFLLECENMEGQLEEVLASLSSSSATEVC